MGKLINLFKASVPAQRPALFASGPEVRIEIVGEASYQPVIRKIAKKYRDASFAIVLQAQPNNPYDPNAVAVLVDGAVVGYLAKGLAKKWQPTVLSAQSEGYLIGGRASVWGGTPDKPHYGVFGVAVWPGRGSPPA